MTRIAYAHPFSGASGDMILGAMVDAGLAVETLETALQGLRLDGWKLKAQKEMRGPFEATRLRVLTPGSPGPGGDGASHHHHHHHSAGPDEHHHEHHHEHGSSAGAPPARNLTAILELIDRSDLPARVQEDAAAVFRRLGQAEAKVHGLPLDEVHFHEVGAVDSIVDIVGSCLGFHLLGIETIYSAPITVGTGYVRGDHGTMPLPAPATLELLRGFPVEQRDTRAELTTPTGAALLTTLARRFGPMPPLTVGEVGYGAGDNRPGPVPNVLRLILAEENVSAPHGDRICVLETAIDDMSPEWLGHLMDQLFAAGALDVAFTPTLMKKGRPGHEVKVLVTLNAEAEIVRVLFRESTTFGLRRTETERVVLERDQVAVETPWGTVRVKIGRLGNEVVTVSPEHGDLKTIAEKSGQPLKELHRYVLERYDDRTDTGQK